MKTIKHLSRKELIEAAKKPNQKQALHLSMCRECSEAVNVMKTFRVVRQLPLPDAPSGWVANAIAIAEGSGVIEKARRLVAELIFDSWAVPHPAGVRGGAYLGHRRIRFQAGEVIFDFRAEQQKVGWGFIAQLTSRSGTPMRLIIGKKTVAMDKNGLYQWVGKRPPKKISLVSKDLTIDLPELSWKKPHWN